MMAKRLVAVRLPEHIVKDLKDMAENEGKSQASLVVEALALLHDKLLYINGKGKQENDLSYTKEELVL